MFLPNAVSRAAYRIDDLARHRRVWELYRGFQRSAAWSADEIERFQVLKLRELLTEAGRHSSYYATVLDEAGVRPEEIRSISDLARLPVLTREIVRSRQQEIRHRQLPARELLPNNTSGSTGSITRFWVDRECWRWRDAASLQVWERMDVPALSPTVNVWGASIDESRIVGLRNRVRQFLDNKRVISAFRLGDEDMERCFRFIARTRPRVLTGYASVIDSIATFVLKSGARWVPPEGFTVVTQAEMLYAEQRENIRRALGGRVLNLYGSRELGVIATECPACGNMHVLGERHIVELVPSNDGVGQRILVTDLQNRGFPFIRYEIGDLAAPDPEEPCARPHQRFGRVLGRSFAVIRSPEGKAVAGNFFSFLMRGCVPGTEDWQAVQTELDLVEIRVTPRGVITEAAREKVRDEVRRALGDSMRVILTESDRLAPLASGKRNFVSIAPGVRAGSPSELG